MAEWGHPDVRGTGSLRQDSSALHPGHSGMHRVEAAGMPPLSRAAEPDLLAGFGPSVHHTSLYPPDRMPLIEGPPYIPSHDMGQALGHTGQTQHMTMTVHRPTKRQRLATILTEESTARELRTWLEEHGLDKYREKLKIASGKELLRMSHRQLIQDVGKSGAVRFFNALMINKAGGASPLPSPGQVMDVPLKEEASESKDPLLQRWVKARDQLPASRRFLWFTNSLGRLVRLHNKPAHLMDKAPSNTWCILCSGHTYVSVPSGKPGGDAKRRRRHVGHKTSFRCRACKVHLCVKPLADDPQSRSCFIMWHEMEHLVKRGPGASCYPPRSRGGGSWYSSAAAGAAVATTAAPAKSMAEVMGAQQSSAVVHVDLHEPGEGGMEFSSLLSMPQQEAGSKSHGPVAAAAAAAAVDSRQEVHVSLVPLSTEDADSSNVTVALEPGFLMQAGAGHHGIYMSRSPPEQQLSHIHAAEEGMPHVRSANA